jgi:hypothetical protein
MAMVLVPYLEADMPIVPLALLGALVYVFINTLKLAQAKQWGSVLTQVGVWVAGVAAVFLVGASKIGETIKFTVGQAPTQKVYTLTSLDTFSKLVLGLLASSLFATSYNQFIKARDNNDTAVIPPMLTSLNQPIAPAVVVPPVTPNPAPFGFAEDPDAPKKVTKKSAGAKKVAGRFT